MYAIFRRELKAYFYSPIAYILIGLFIFISAIFFLQNLFGQIGDFNGNLSTMSFLFIFIIPILTMRTFAEDRKNGTEVLLITSPANLTSIVTGKFLAAFCVLLVITLISFIFPVILFSFGAKLTAQLVGGYVGFILLGGACISVGVFASSLTENQIIAAIISFVCLLTMWVVNAVAQFAGGTLSTVLDWFSITSRYDEFARGILDLSPVVYYLSFTAVFLFLTVRTIEKRRWSQG